jgi:hypothetical protein
LLRIDRAANVATIAPAGLSANELLSLRRPAQSGTRRMRGVRGAGEDDRFIAGQSMQKVFVLFDKLDLGKCLRMRFSKSSDRTGMTLFTPLSTSFVISIGHYHMRNCGTSPDHYRLADAMRGADGLHAAASY